MATAKAKIEYEVIHEHRQCSAEDVSGRNGRCDEIITHWAQPVGYTGPVYCRRHARLAWKKSDE